MRQVSGHLARQPRGDRLGQAGALCLTLALSVCVATASAGAAQELGDGIDLLDGLRDGWDAHWMQQRMASSSTSFSVVLDDMRSVLQADSNAAAAALWRRFDLRRPTRARLSWRWRVDSRLETRVDERSRQGDDFAARIMVAFGTDVMDRDTRAIAYVWARDLDPGTRFPNPYRRRVATIVLRSGADLVGRWSVEERDLLADYERAFSEPPERIGGIAFVVDTDNTGTRVRSWLSDLRLTSVPPPFD